MAITKVINDLIDLNATDATKSLKMPSGAAYSGTAQDGMVRNDTDGDSQGSASTMQHFNGTDWKNYENLPNPITVDYLVVAGGGSGGYGSGGGPGGGGGGYRTTTTYSGSETPLAASLGTAYTVEVGAGALSTIGTGVDGEDSKFGIVSSEIISTGGGGGNDSGNGRVGGSGGGGGNQNGATSGIGGAASPAGQGNVGGNAASIGTNDGNNAGAGGGGAGAVGGNASSGAGGNGGNGTSISITGSAVPYAGGGGGVCRDDLTEGTGGTGGGGAGGWPLGNPGAINTGGGGGGARDATTSSSGGSGTVILRYPTASVSSHAVTGTLDTVADTAYPIANTAYYKLEGGSGTTVTDSSGNGNNGVSTNVTYAAGRFGQAAVFNGSSSRITTNLITPNTQDLSWSLWVKDLVHNGSSSMNTLLLDYKNNYAYINYTSSNTLYANARSSSTNADIDVQSSAFDTSSWRHIVFVSSLSSGSFLYIDGALVDSNTVSMPSRLSINYGSGLEIGWNPAEGSPFTDYALDASIDQVRIFNSALSAANVTSLYNESTVNESTDGTDSILQFIGGTGTVTFS